MSACDNIKPKLQLTVKLYQQETILPMKEFWRVTRIIRLQHGYFLALNSTQRQNAQLETEMVFKLATIKC